jgi:hypothetical protein
LRPKTPTESYQIIRNDSPMLKDGNMMTSSQISKAESIKECDFNAGLKTELPQTKERPERPKK